MAKMSKVRRPILKRDALFSVESYFTKEKYMDMPTINRKNGKTRSVGVQPCHSECLSGG